METKKEAFKKFVIEQLKDFDYWREASPEGYAETIVDEAVKLFCQPDVVGRGDRRCNRRNGCDAHKRAEIEDASNKTEEA